jgi:predicted Fe-Mo cluster-binding NifX family protein
MRIVVSSQGDNLDAAASPVFGRCPTYLFVNTETMVSEAVPNPAMNQGGGAGIQAAQFVVNQGAEAVLSGNLGPNAFDVLQAAAVPGYLIAEGTVREAVKAYKEGRLQQMAGPNVQSHAGTGGGMWAGREVSPTMAGAPPASASREAELAKLGETLKSLRRQLVETMARIEELEKEA